MVASPPSLHSPTARNQRGLTFLGVLFAVAIGSIGLAGTGALWQMESRREKEKELLFVGEEYRRAIGSYYDKSPGNPAYPTKLADLLLDPRFPVPVRHLRRLYADPMNPNENWELLRREGSIIGIASRSTETPIKIGNFPAYQSSFEGAKRYADWQFIHASGVRPRINTPALNTHVGETGR